MESNFRVGSRVRYHHVTQRVVEVRFDQQPRHIFDRDHLPRPRPHTLPAMATRRPASSRARYPPNNNTMPPPQQRPRSVMEKPTSSTSSSRTSEDLQSSSGSTPALQRPKTTGDGDTHIQVVLRCRGRSEREIQENSPGIVQINGAKSKDLTIETSAPVSSMGIVNPPPTRTYPFDLVFGTEATQSMIYHDVVGPMLEEVLMGYNCTLFAYGQTGTGKTYVSTTPLFLLVLIGF